MTLVNFKGIRDLTIEFQPSVTSIFGANGSGKTSIFDAFTWVLFGKDSRDRKSFDIKTLDASGEAIPKLPHEVSILLLVNGEQINLTRRYSEKWQKKRGSAVETFTGHEEERLYNDVPCSIKEWNEKIASICDELVFKFITNPAYFTAQKTDIQRAMLIDMAGNISDEEIAAENADFKALLAQLTGKSMEEYKREIAAKKRRLKAEIDAIPERIDERKRDTPESTDFASVEEEIKQKQERLREIETQLTDISTSARKLGDAKLAKTRTLGDLRVQLSTIEQQINQRELSEYSKACADNQRLEFEKRNLKEQRSRSLASIERLKKDIAAAVDRRQVLIAEWQGIQAETLEFNADDFKCPTCGRPFEVADIEKKQNEMTARFNTRKEEKLADNLRRGQALKERRLSYEREVETLEKEVASLDEKIAQLDATTINIPTPPENSILLARYKEDEQHVSLSTKIAALEKEISEITEETPDTSELKEAREVLRGSIEELNKILARRVLIGRNNARISELETQLRKQSQELADLEAIEFTMAAFSKARIEAVERKINSLFRIVSFKMFAQQINGGEVETCEAVVDGVPYSSLNNAKQINAGLDIINAISRAKGISAPIFIDNAESVLQLENSDSQIVRLVVSDTPSLIIE